MTKTKITDEDFIRERERRAAMDEYFERRAAIERSTPEGQLRRRVADLIAMALNGHPEPLIEYLTEGGEMIEVLRPIFLKLLRTVKLGRHERSGRPRTSKQITRELAIVGQVADLEASGHQTKSAVSIVAVKYGLQDVRQIYNYLARYDDVRQSILDDVRAEGLDGPP